MSGEEKNSLPLEREAEQALESYLRRVRLSLRGTSVDAEEVERDVREHIEQALASPEGAVPVGAVPKEELQKVLERLGSPSQWVPEEEVPWWRRALLQWQVGSEDWRLAYLCFGLTVLGLVTTPIGGPLLWIPAYLLGRAARSLAAERGEALGAKRWLIYPPMVLVSLSIAAVLLLGPMMPLAVWGIQEGFADRFVQGAAGNLESLAVGLARGGMVAMAIGLWWLILAPLSAWTIGPLRALVAPLLDRYERRHAWWLALAGLVVAAVGATLLFLA